MKNVIGMYIKLLRRSILIVFLKAKPEVSIKLLTSITSTNTANLYSVNWNLFVAYNKKCLQFI